MAEKLLRREKAHQRYYIEIDGKRTRVPGVTTICNVLAKPALVPWANRMGLQGIDTKNYVDSKAEIGTCAHYLIQCGLENREPDLSEFPPVTVDQAENAYLKWLDWSRDLEAIKCEMQLVSTVHRYGGTCDVYAKVKGAPCLVDIKTGKSGIWPEMRHQVSAYRQLLIENGYPVEQVWIVRVGRDELEGFQTERVSNIDKHFELFLHCRAIYELQKRLK